MFIVPPFITRLMDNKTTGFKRQKLNNIKSNEMALFAPSSAQFLRPPSKTLARKTSHQVLQVSQDADLSPDLDISFASTVSLNSPPRDDISLDSSSFFDPMDISPAPKARHTMGKAAIRTRSMTSGARLFGSDISNGKILPHLGDSSSPLNTKGVYYPTISTRWMSSTEPTSPVDDAMDVDSSFIIQTAPEDQSFEGQSFEDQSFEDQSFERNAASAASKFQNLFYETTSPCRAFSAGKKRRSISPGPSPERNRLTFHQNSSTPLLSSPEKQVDSEEEEEEGPIISPMPAPRSKPMLRGLGGPGLNTLKRPRGGVVVSSMLPRSDPPQIQSAHPISVSGGESRKENTFIKGLPPVRRAFSALLAPGGFGGSVDEDSSFDNSFEGPDMSSPAQAYAKRQQSRTLRRRDGTEDFKPIKSPVLLALRNSPSAKLVTAGLSGFGDNEAQGKILPCHRVREDGLMRIKPKTLDRLLDGEFDDKIVQFHVIDCRFDYEYNGGHVQGAININTTAGVEEFLLTPKLSKPVPSVSSESGRKVVIIFHCEFSAKRGPTFAKHLRAKDRATNHHVYPKVHYPEVYVLEGGYCGYYKVSKNRCEPRGYVRMDDPKHAMSRAEDLNLFRKAKFGRTKSYAFGEAPGSKAGQVQQVQTHPPKRSISSNASTVLFPASNPSRSQRNSAPLDPLPEDGNATFDGDDTDIDIGDSPCPPPSKTAGKRIGRTLARTETYGSVRMPF